MTGPDELTGYSLTHGHDLPEVQEPPGTYAYEDGCAVIKHADGSSTYVPNGEVRDDRT